MRIKYTILVVFFVTLVIIEKENKILSRYVHLNVNSFFHENKCQAKYYEFIFTFKDDKTVSLFS